MAVYISSFKREQYHNGKVLRVRIFPFVAFSQGIFSHLLLRDNNDWYLRETKDIAKEKEKECSWLRGILLGRAAMLRVRGWA